MAPRWLEEVRALVGPRGVVTRTRAVAYESDGLTMERGEGVAVVLPRDTAETADLHLPRLIVRLDPGVFELHDAAR